jgi:hypothetical protein
VHGDLVLRGWLPWFVFGSALVLVAGAVAVLVSALRRPAEDFGALGRWPWVLVQGTFVATSAFAAAANLLHFGRAVPRAFAGVFGVLLVVAAIQQIAYLLRVVFPSPRRAEREDATPLP